MALRAYLPELLFFDGRFQRDLALIVEKSRIVSVGTVPPGAERIPLPGRAALPGLVNAHSHAFQRAIRGTTEWRAPGHASDDFWTWREQMYAAAMALSPEGLHAVSRMCFLEMALSGITTVGEFHYLHRDPQGQSYANANELAEQVIAAAGEVGIRIALLRVAYARSGFGTPPNPRQVRFIDPDVETYLAHADALHARFRGPEAWVGAAPHSVRAVPAEWIRAIGAHARTAGWKLHMHVAEQPKEVRDCQSEHGQTPVALLETAGVLDANFTAVHAVHLDARDRALLSAARAIICACPTTERNLGDGIVDPTVTFTALGSDSQTQIDLLEDARELEYHLRLQQLERAVLAPRDGTGGRSALAARLLGCATIQGARSLGSGSGSLAPGESADFFTVDLDDPSIAGASDADLLGSVVFSLARTAVRDVVVSGRPIIEGGRHRQQAEIVSAYRATVRSLWEHA